MICPECGNDLKSSRQRYDYASLAGLDPQQYTVLLEDVNVEECDCGQTPEIRGVERLQYLIGLELVRHTEPLRSSAIRFLRKLLGMRQEDFGELVGVTPECVSKWENAAEIRGAQPVGARQEIVLRLHVLVKLLDAPLLAQECAPSESVMFRALCEVDQQLRRGAVRPDREVCITPPWEMNREDESSPTS